MIITLTDKDGISFSVDTDHITSVCFKDGCTISLDTGERIPCRETAQEYLAKVGESYAAFFGGAL
jgi:uncharacterized protein YlzI (FlbEa/FlbD family)